MQQIGARPDPAPSRWAYRYQRMMLTPFYRRLLRVGLPVCLVLGIAAAYLSDPDVQAGFQQRFVDLREQIARRPEFMVAQLSVDGASDRVASAIQGSFPYDLPISSFDINLDDVRRQIETFPAVATAAVRLKRGGVLSVAVTERQPAALLRTDRGLKVVDVEGVVIAKAPSRQTSPELPLMTGDGAARHVGEALHLYQAAGPLRARVHGLVRMGERRWDVVLNDGARILLPVENPVRALERVIVLNDSQDVLARDIVAMDMRLVDRPTLRMKERAVKAWWRVRNMGLGSDEP